MVSSFSPSWQNVYAVEGSDYVNLIYCTTQNITTNEVLIDEMNKDNVALDTLLKNIRP